MQPVVHIVDDDASVRASTSFLLRSRGFASEIYASGEEFLKEGKPGVGCVLLDLRMPDLDGFAIQAELARRNLTIPVIMMTGHGDVPSAVRALRLGATDFIEKPFTEEALAQSVERALAISLERHQREARHGRALTRLRGLSPRENQILRGVVAGMTNKEIARRFDISHRTVEMHRANMMRDLECESLTDVIRLAIEAEIAPLPRDGAEEDDAPEAMKSARN
ncbi:MAG TPA: response regulator [Allosphingosinicella sp.]